MDMPRRGPVVSCCGGPAVMAQEANGPYSPKGKMAAAYPPVV